jgi:hypothetical protein
MKQTHSICIESQTKKLGLSFLGEIDFDSTVEVAIGDKNKLLDTNIGQTLKQVVKKL